MAFNLFGKKKEETLPEIPVNNTIPVSQVLNMKSQGMNNAQIANQLRAQGYSLSQIRDAISQAEIKSAVAPPEMPPIPETPASPEMPPLPQMPAQEQMQTSPKIPPTPNFPPMPEVPPMPQLQPQKIPETPKPQPQIPQGTEGLVDELQRIIEDIIEEKWKDVEDKISTLDSWKARVEDKVSSLSSKVSELNKRIDDFSKTLVSKTEEYKGTMNDVNTQMEAIEKIMGKLVPGLAEEIKELRHVVEKMKKK